MTRKVIRPPTARPRPRRAPVRLRVDPSSRLLPLWIHQLVEYLLAVLFGELGLHLRGAAEWVVLGGAALVLMVALGTRGPLGLLRALSPKAHHAADLVVVTLFALAPLADLHRRDWLGIVLLELIAAGLLRISRMTRYQPRVRSEGAATQALSTLGAALQPSLAALARGTRAASRRRP
ncbi:MAG: hypothetical protein ACRDYD_11930, partial [Acidimicrobiales bacterium]